MTANENQSSQTRHRTIKIGDLDIFFREAGPVDAPTILLLHGFSDFVAYVPQPDTRAVGSIPCGCAGLSWFRGKLHADHRRIRLHLR